MKIIDTLEPKRIDEEVVAEETMELIKALEPEEEARVPKPQESEAVSLHDEEDIDFEFRDLANEILNAEELNELKDCVVALEYPVGASIYGGGDNVMLSCIPYQEEARIVKNLVPQVREK